MKSRLTTIIVAATLWCGFLSVPVLQVGCSAPSTRVAQVQTLKSVGQTAEAAVAISAQLYRDGKITGVQARQVADFYDKKFQPVFHVAVSAVNANLDSIASTDVINIASQLSALVLQLQSNSP